MVTPELKWPMTNLTPSPTNLVGDRHAFLGVGAVITDRQR